jgi:hypothetical protein
MQQLTELRFGSATEKSDGNNNIFTVGGFKAVVGSLEAMPELTVLDMQLPHVKEFNINGKSTC